VSAVLARSLRSHVGFEVGQVLPRNFARSTPARRAFETDSPPCHFRSESRNVRVGPIASKPTPCAVFVFSCSGSTVEIRSRSFPLARIPARWRLPPTLPQGATNSVWRPSEPSRRAPPAWSSSAVVGLHQAHARLMIPASTAGLSGESPCRTESGSVR